jgi:hypothetical protein
VHHNPDQKATPEPRDRVNPIEKLFQKVSQVVQSAVPNLPPRVTRHDNELHPKGHKILVLKSMCRHHEEFLKEKDPGRSVSARTSRTSCWFDVPRSPSETSPAMISFSRPAGGILTNGDRYMNEKKKGQLSDVLIILLN